MIVADSKLARRLVGRLDRGADLVASLLEVCAARGVRAAAVRAQGALEEFDLRELDQRLHAFRAVRHFTTPATLLQLSGVLAERDGRPHLEATVSVSRERDNGIEVLGGFLVRARVHAVEFVIESFDDLVLRRAQDAATGLPLLAEAQLITPSAGAAVRAEADGGPVRALPAFEAPARGRVVEAEEPAAEPAAPTWGEVAAVSGAVTAAAAVAPPPSEEQLRPGDVLEHFKFGPCTVERIEGDGEIVHLRLRNQRLVRLSLDVLQVEFAGAEPDGTRRRFLAVTPR